MHSRARAMVCGTCFVLLLGIAHLLVLPGQGIAQTLPNPPQVFLDTTYLPPSGKTITVNAGGDFQSALNSAQLGDTIVLQAGATFTGPFTLPNKTSGSGWIYILSSSLSSLPAPGTRVGPSQASLMPKLVATTAGYTVINTVAGSHHYRFVGIEISPASGQYLANVVNIGNDEGSYELLPHDITFDRCYIHGDPRAGARRGIQGNGAAIAVVDSYLSDFKEVGADTQAFASWNGAGPFKLVNNYLEAAAENVMFGGAGPSVYGLIPSDIEFRQNYSKKPLTWRQGDPSYGGVPYSVKNLFELKNAQRLLIEGNVFEYSWAAAQVGFAIVLTPRNEVGNTPWETVQDVTFQKNVVRHSGSGVNMLGVDTNFPSGSGQLKRVLIKDNIFADINSGIWGGNGRLFQCIMGNADLTIDHNTGFQTGSLIMADGSTVSSGTIFGNNIVTNGNYGVIGTGTQSGSPTLAYYFPGIVFTKNAIIGPYPSSGGVQPSMYGAYQTVNFFPQGPADVPFVNYGGGDYRLASGSPYKNAGTDGKDLGADIDAVNSATAGVIQGTPGGSGTAVTKPTSPGPLQVM